MLGFVETKRTAIEQLCRKYEVARLELFGSAADDTFDAARSDVDFLVEFHRTGPMGAADQYFGLLEELEALFARKVDLVCAGAMQNPYFIRRVNESRTLLYAA